MGINLEPGNTVDAKIIKIGGSVGLLLIKEITEYLDIGEGDEVVIKCEKGRWGAYIGIGKKGKH